MSRRIPRLDPSRDAVVEQQRMVRQTREFLDAMTDRSAYRVTRAAHRGHVIEIVTAMRPDGRAQVTSEIHDAQSSCVRTRLWLVDKSKVSQALITALRDACTYLDALEPKT